MTDFVPRSGAVAAPALMRYWIGDDGRYWRVEHYSSGRRLLKAIDNVRYVRAAGAERVAGMRIRSGAESAEVAVSKLSAKNSPEEWFDPAALPLIKP